MNYEQRYNEALDRAKEFYNDESCRVGMTPVDLEVIFPELKESEGEKIRKQIISFLKEFECNHYRSLDFSSWIAWLEKQGEQKPIDKPNKVEPVFHEGDWVVCEFTGSVYQIKDCVENLQNHKYGYDLTDGGYIGSDEVNHYHLWTIKDAKDGDVLVSVSNQPFIYNGKFTEYTVGAYCGLNVYGVFVVEKYLKESNWTNNDNIRPATKEQRDILMKEIHRANFKWDADKKELKKCKL